MKIMIVGSDKVYAIENYYQKYLAEAGHDVALFTAQNYFYEFYQKSVFNKILFKLSLSRIISKINGLFINKVIEFQPDLIWIFKGMEISPTSLAYVRTKNIKLVNYNPDNPFIFSGPGSGNKYITESIPLYDLHFTYNLSVLAKLRSEYTIQTEFLPFGFDLTQEDYQLCVRQDEILKLCFAGNPDKNRVIFIKQMADRGIKIDVYGNDWARYIHHPGVKIFSPEYGIDFWKILRRYRLQLNLMRIHNEDSHNMRTFEIPAVGGIMLAPRTKEHEMFFEEDTEAFWFNNIEDAVFKANKILSLPFPEAEQIRNKARDRSLLSGYSYRDRTLKALDKLNVLTGR